jgi:hypothetical protein
MDINKILDAMEAEALNIFEGNEEYANDGKRGVMAAYIRNKKNKDQWDGSLRNFGAVFRDYDFEDELVINNGVNFDALVHGKLAFSRRTGLDSGTNYYQVLGSESWWKGSVISDDGICLCAFAGFSGEDDRAIAQAGIGCYEASKPAAASAVEAQDDGDGESGEADEVMPPKAGLLKKSKASRARAAGKKGKS